MTVSGLTVARAVVCGGGYSGQAIARALRRLGAEVSVTDDRPADSDIMAAASRVLADLGVTLHPGSHDAALMARADLVVVSPGVPWHLPALAVARAAGVPVWGEIELASRLTRARLIGITGTKGKSTTAALVAKMLDAPLTNSEAYSARGIPLVELAVENPKADPVVVEVTSYQLEGIVAFRPWVATLLNIAEDHTDRHPTRADYVAAKQRIFENQRNGDRSVYNLDDATVRGIGEALPTLRLGVSEHEAPDYGVWSEGDSLHVRLPADLGGFCGRLLGWSAVSDGLRVQRPSVLAATATALAAEADIDVVRDTLHTFPGLPHRMEQVAVVDGVTFVNDSKATNPLAVANALAQSPAPVVLIAGGLTKGIDLSPLVEPFARLRGLVLIGRDAPLLADVAARAGVAQVRSCGSLAEAVDTARDLARRGDWVILSPCGASFDMFENFAHRGEQFRACVAALTA
jgi:UDP-N-acetylmuramoylalanine--D-glutamate ligase